MTTTPTPFTYFDQSANQRKHAAAQANRAIIESMMQREASPKDMARATGLSVPTVRNYMYAIKREQKTKLAA